MKLDTTATFLEKDGKITLVSDKYQHTFGYYSNNPWVSDDICVMARSENFENREIPNELVLVDYAARTVTELGIESGDFVV
ncbi:MAG: hypothetical protein J6C52_04040, partial [Clostridia bacterium]|nr:hypothetical protein [Clostridia bacterium]